jgi:hypothetical protein
VLNTDEFFVLLSDSGKFTWTKKTAGNVQVSGNKLGFTCSILTNMAGQVLCLQIIWKGMTDQVHAKSFDGQRFDSRIFQQHRPGTHFQNWVTFAGYAVEICRIVDEIRERNPDIRNPTAVMLLDHASSHGVEGGHDEAAEEAAAGDRPDDGDGDEEEADEEEHVEAASEVFARNNVRIIAIPKCCTHVFQPADQYIIPGVKSGTRAATTRHLGEMFIHIGAQNAAEAAVTALTNAAPRNVAEAIQAAQDAAVRAAAQVAATAPAEQQQYADRTRERVQAILLPFSGTMPMKRAMKVTFLRRRVGD